MKHRNISFLNSGLAKHLLFLLLAAWLNTGISATAPFLEKIDIFKAGENGFALYRIPGIVVTTKGTVLAYCEARKSKSDWAEIEIYLRRSTDGGKTWNAPKQIAHLGPRLLRSAVALKVKKLGDKEQTVNNPVAIVDRETGAIHFLYCINYERAFYLRSDDDGVTFSKPVEISSTFEKFRPEYDCNVIATGPDHGIQLANGRLVVPVWLSTGAKGHGPSVTATVFSDDHGKSWQRGDIAIPDTEKWVNPNETVIVQLADGRVMLNTRSLAKENRRIVTTSPDGATKWSGPRFDNALLEPICMASIVRLSLKPASDKNRILFANPDNLSRADGKEVPGGHRDRKNLSVKLSYDEAQTWPVNKVLEPGASAYSDLAVLPDGTILCFYERSKLLTVARFNLEWLTDGKDSLSKAK